MTAVRRIAFRLTTAALLVALPACKKTGSPGGGAASTSAGTSGGSIGTGATSSGGSGTTGSAVPQGTPAALGPPTTTLFNGLATVVDPMAHTPIHSYPSVPAELPTGLAGTNLPYIPSINVLARRDTIIAYFPNVAGAADYRAYGAGANVSFVTTPNGLQPRGAEIACAGFRQHTYESALVDGHHARELLQAVELPGFYSPGTYTVVLEALASPCPFPGLIGNADATMTMAAGMPPPASNSLINWFNSQDPSMYPYSGIPRATITSFQTMLSRYGNQILNGQGAAGSIDDILTEANGVAVPPGDATFPSDPVVLARSAITVQLPFENESLIAPVIDVGPNSTVDDFETPLTVDPATIAQNPDYQPGPSASPLVDIPGAWEFWGRLLNQADGEGIVNGQYSVTGMHGLQIFEQFGRLYTVFGDAGQDVGGTLSFSSLKVNPLQMDPNLFIHSRFRLNAEGTHRRYWYWTLCGGATSAELFDSTTGHYVLRPLMFETSFRAGGDNPSVPNSHTLGGPPTTDAQIGDGKTSHECLSLALEGRPEPPRTDGSPRASGVIRAQIHPAGYRYGIIALGNNSTDIPVASGPNTLGFRYLVDSTGKYAGPVLEPFDQLNPITHFDVFVRPNQLVVFINGRQGICVDLSDHPLTMAYGMVGYGDLIYHSSLEQAEIMEGVPSAFTNSGGTMHPEQLYQYELNAPIASTRFWDEVGQTDLIPIPAQLPAYNPALCMKPATVAIQ